MEIPQIPCQYTEGAHFDNNGYMYFIFMTRSNAGYAEPEIFILKIVNIKCLITLWLIRLLRRRQMTIVTFRITSQPNDRNETSKFRFTVLL